MFGAPGDGEVWRKDRNCYLREFQFLGLVVLITAVETVDNPVSPRDSGVKGCSSVVGTTGFKQAVDGENILGRLTNPQFGYGF